MTGTRQDKPTGTEPLREEALEKLFRHTDQRRAPPEHVRQQVRAAAHAEWRQLSRRRWKAPAAMAAAAILVIAVALFLFGRPFSSGPGFESGELARVISLAAPALAHTPDGDEIEIETEMALRKGYRVASSASGGLAIAWHDGLSLRLDRETELVLTDELSLELITGQIYVDTRSAEGQPLGIDTPSGSLQHLGTQYMVAVSLQGTTVSVRSGQVQLELPGNQVVSGGEELEFTMEGVRAFRRIETHGEQWLWAENLAPAWAADGRTVAEFLDWVAAETGRTIEYDTPEAKRLAETSRLKGEIQAEPAEALALVLQATELEALPEGSIIRVKKRAEN